MDELARHLQQVVNAQMARDDLARFRSALRAEAERLAKVPASDGVVITVDQCEVLTFIACMGVTFNLSAIGMSVNPKALDVFLGRDTSTDTVALAKLGLINGVVIH